MREFLYRLVQRLHDEARPLSRNKHFHAFEGESRRALRIDRHLRDLELHLAHLRDAGGQRPRVRALPDGGVHLVLRVQTEKESFAVVLTRTNSGDYQATQLAR